jgi:chorismate mutase
MNMFTTEKPYIIAGPCSAESKEQLTATVDFLSKTDKVSLIRCGVWKPRTRPGGFEGMGIEALQWIAELKQRYPQARFATEVAKPEHVELCLEYGINTVWIGARTTGNPFSMKELCECLKGTDMNVMVKNPLTPDAKLWIGAIERLMGVGIKGLAAIHRGFCTHNYYGYRNSPLWDIPMQIKQSIPGIVLLCDPSHIGGHCSLVKNISQIALDLGFDGLMVEVHPSPQSALTDSEQQLSFDDFISLLSDIIPHSASSASAADGELKMLREKIDEMDNELISIISQRLDIVRQIGELKMKNNLPAYQPERWKEVLETRIANAKTRHNFSLLSPDFFKNILELIHDESLRLQREMMKKGDK